MDGDAASQLLELYTGNLLWSLFLTSTALHAILLIASPLYVSYCKGATVWIRCARFQAGRLQVVQKAEFW